MRVWKFWVFHSYRGTDLINWAGTELARISATTKIALSEREIAGTDAITPWPSRILLPRITTRSTSLTASPIRTRTCRTICRGLSAIDFRKTLWVEVHYVALWQATAASTSQSHLRKRIPIVTRLRQKEASSSHRESTPENQMPAGWWKE